MSKKTLEECLRKKPLYIPLVASLFYSIINVGEYIVCRDYLQRGHPETQVVELRKGHFYAKEQEFFSDNKYRIGELTFNLSVVGRKIAIATK